MVTEELLFLLACDGRRAREGRWAERAEEDEEDEDEEDEEEIVAAEEGAAAGRTTK